MYTMLRQCWFAAKFNNVAALKQGYGAAVRKLRKVWLWIQLQFLAYDVIVILYKLTKCCQKFCWMDL